MKTTWRKPDLAKLTEYQRSYVNLVPEGELPQILEKNMQETISMLSVLPQEKLSYRYAPGKWSIPQILLHITDTERIFSYRILCIARGDKTPLPGFEENDYAAASRADERSFSSVVQEFTAVRRATIELFKNLDAEMRQRTGISNGREISVLALCFMITGHGMHHLRVMREKYLS